MIRSKFLSCEDRRELLSCVKRQREDHGIARNANAHLLLDNGKSCIKIVQVLYLDDDTVRIWHKQYLFEGWDPVFLTVEKASNRGCLSRREPLFAFGLRNIFADLQWKSAPMSRRSAIWNILIQAVLSF